MLFLLAAAAALPGDAIPVRRSASVAIARAVIVQAVRIGHGRPAHGRITGPSGARVVLFE